MTFIIMRRVLTIVVPSLSKSVIRRVGEVFLWLDLAIHGRYEIIALSCDGSNGNKNIVQQANIKMKP